MLFLKKLFVVIIKENNSNKALMKILTIILIIITVGSASAEENPQGLCSEIYKHISDTNIRNYVRYLAADSLKGRGTGTNEEILSAEYIADQLENYSIKALGDNNSYFQYVPMHGITPKSDSRLSIHSDSGIIAFSMYDDYIVYKSGATTYLPKPVEMVFVGYGITAPEFDYDDYQDVDVTGKIVVFIGGEPASEEASYFNGSVPTIYSSPEAKQRLALAHGASGSIYIPSPDEQTPGYWEHIVNDLKFEYVTLAYSVSDNLSIAANPESVEALFLGSEHNIKEIYDMYYSNNIKTFKLSSKLEFRGKYINREFKGRNVIGIIEGTDNELKDSYLIYSAHYDHLGIGPEIQGDSIYNGLFDNALGCAGLLEIARLYSEFGKKTKRSIIFIFVTGEEKGLLGSRYYVDTPQKPLYKTIANINIDGLAAIDNFSTLIPIGSNFSTLEDFIAQSAESCNLEVEEFPDEFIESQSFNRSDQIAFAQAGIPSCMVLDGTFYKNIDRSYGLSLLYDYFNNIYHTPFDDLNQPINYSASKQHIQYLFTLGFQIANSQKSPEWKEGVIYIQERLRTQSEKR